MQATTVTPIKQIETLPIASLHLKFLAVQQQLKPLEKSGKNSFHKYSYTTASDVLEPVREACNANGLILYASVTDSRVDRGQAWVNVKLTCSDPQSGESIECCAVGYAEEWNKDNKPTGDKAVYKAQTGAIKYAVRLMFCLPSEDDPERELKNQNSEFRISTPSKFSRTEESGLISDAQRKRLFTLAKENNLEPEQVKEIIARWHYSSSSEIKRSDYDKICNAIALIKS
jgi:ERF superfamily